MRFNHPALQRGKFEHRNNLLLSAEGREILRPAGRRVEGRNGPKSQTVEGGIEICLPKIIESCVLVAQRRGHTRSHSEHGR